MSKRQCLWSPRESSPRDGKGHPLENKKRLSALSEELYDTIMHSLRRGDSFTQYSPSQFLILLVGTSKENCQMIFERIGAHAWNVNFEKIQERLIILRDHFLDPEL